MSRRRLLAATAGFFGAGLLGGCSSSAASPTRTTGSTPSGPPPALAPLTFIRGADLSSTPEVEHSGRSFSDGSTRGPVEQLLAARGVNLVRLRLWVNPPEPGTSDLDTVLALARRARAAGCHLMLNLHYADSWADPFTQPTPQAWAGQGIDQLAETVRRYTHDVVTAFAAQGTTPAIVQPGNEVSNGILWPSGRITQGTTDEWDRLARLIGAGLQGVTDTGLDVRTAVHTDRGGDQAGSERLFMNLLDRGVHFDIAGLSYFPWWHGPLSALTANLDNLAAHLGRKVAVLETSYPWKLPGRAEAAELHVQRATQLPEPDRFPPTRDGQSAFFGELRTIIENVRDGAGFGFAAWEPEWIPKPGWPQDTANRFANQTMFDWTGAALPSIEVFHP